MMKNKSLLKGLKLFAETAVLAVGSIAGTICTIQAGNVFLGLCVLGMAAMAVPEFMKSFKNWQNHKK